MTLLKRISRETALKPFLHTTCCDEGICLDIDERISAADYLVIKVDDYYNSLKLPKTPKSPDCLIVQRCGPGRFAIAIAELKNLKQAGRLPIDEVVAKFETCLSDFIERRFRTLFEQEFQRVQLFFVVRVNVYVPSRDPLRGLRLETLISKPFVFRGKRYLISPHNPGPHLKPCY